VTNPEYPGRAPLLEAGCGSRSVRSGTVWAIYAASRPDHETGCEKKNNDADAWALVKASGKVTSNCGVESCLRGETWIWPACPSSGPETPAVRGLTDDEAG